MDLLDADLDEAISIERGRIALYPHHQRGGGPVAPAQLVPALPGPERAAAAGRQACPRALPPGALHAAVQRRAALLGAPVARSARPAAAVAAAPPPKPRRPPPGEGLNQPALLTFRRMALRQPADRRTVEAFRGRLLEAAARMGGVFVHYDPEQGVWLLKLDAWL